jgi:hypothetical protein
VLPVLATWADAEVRALEALRARHPKAPPPWVQDIDRFIGGVEQRLTADTLPLAEAVFLADSGGALCGSLLARFGRLLRSWSTVCAAAGRLREKEITPAGTP